MKQVTEVAAVNRELQPRRQASPHVRLIALMSSPRREGPSKLELPHVVEHLAAERLARLLELVQQFAIQVAFARTGTTHLLAISGLQILMTIRSPIPTR